MKKLAIKNKLISVFTFLIIILLITGIYSITTLKNVNDISTFIVTNGIPGIQGSSNVNTMTSDLKILEFEHIIATSNEKINEIENSMAEKSNEINNYLSTYEKNYYNG